MGIFGSSGSASDDASVDQAEDIQEGTSTLSPTMMNSSMPTKLESSPSPTILSTSSGTSTLTNATSTSHKLIVSYVQIYFGGGIRKFTPEQFEGFEKNMKEYARGKNPPVDLSVECEVTHQGNLRLRNERPRPIFKAAKLFLNKRKKQLLSQKKSRPGPDLLNGNIISTSEEIFDNNLDFDYGNRILQDAECIPQNNLSLTIDFNITWSSDLMTEEELKCYQINYENFMFTHEGSKNKVTEDLNSIGVCANKAMNFKSSDQTSSPPTTCLTAMPLSAPPTITAPPTFPGTPSLSPNVTLSMTSSSTLSPTIMNTLMPSNESSPSSTTYSLSSTIIPVISSPSPTPLSSSGSSTLLPTIMNSSTPTNLESSGSASNDESIVAEEDIMSSSMPTNLGPSGSTSNDENADGSADEGTSTLSPTVVNSSIPTNLESSHSPSAILTILNTTDSPTPSTYTISGSFSGSFTSTYLPTNQ